MLSTAIYLVLDSRPAAFSRAVVKGELRNRLGFQGVTITDSLGSAAVADFGGQREAAVDGAAAGDDLLLFDDLPSALAGHEALVKHLAKGGLERAPFEVAAQRVLRLRASAPRRRLAPGGWRGRPRDARRVGWSGLCSATALAGCGRGRDGRGCEGSMGVRGGRRSPGRAGPAVTAVPQRSGVSVVP